MKEPISSSIDLIHTARREMLHEGFLPDLPDEVVREVESLDEDRLIAAESRRVQDLRALLWSSIDNHESLDLDQVEVAERLDDGHIRVRVGIADVDAFAARGSAIDQHAARNTVSVYTGIETFPMLPERLSTQVTSLLEGVDRLALVVDFSVASDETTVTNGIYRALIRNHAKLDYEAVGLWLEGSGPIPERVARIAGLEDQLRLQDEATQRLGKLRRRNGALDFETIEASPVMVNGEVSGLAVKHKSRARYLIENLMITANVGMADYLEKQGSPCIQRVVHKPERWPRIVEIARSFNESLPEEPEARALAGFLAKRKAADPEHYQDLSLSIVKLLGPGEYVVVPAGAEHDGHFGLAVQDYTHSTAPNRRYVDLVTQRLVKATMEAAAHPYNETELAEIAAHCEERQSAARKVERFMRKVIAAEALHKEIGKIFEAIVTGVSAKGTFARLISPPAEGRIMRGESGLDVGDKIRVRLLATEPQKGFIDFERTTE
jgi:exoribonuclease-2